MEVEGTVEGFVSEAVEVPQEPLKKCGSDAAQFSVNGCFDCNICLDFAVDPVVTLCGHLFCWPCIYKWLQVGSKSLQQCPVCKASLSQNALVPLYGRGLSSKRTQQQSLEIPRRPSSVHRDQSVIASMIGSTNDEQFINLQRPMQQREQQHYHYPHYSYTNNNSYMLGGIATAVLPWMFRNHEAGMYYSSPYYLMGNRNSSRLRRQEIQVERLLHQIWMFLFCCAGLCLILF